MLETPGEAIFLRVHPDWRDDQAAAIRRSGCSSLRVTLRGSPLSSRPVAAAGSAVAMIPPRLRLADPAAHGARRTCSGELMFASRRAVVFDSSARPRLDLGRVYRFRSTSLAAMPLRHLAADSGDVLLEQRGAKLRESLRRRVIQRAEDRSRSCISRARMRAPRPYTVSKFLGEYLASIRRASSRTSGPGIGSSARYMAGTVRSLRRGLCGERRQKSRAYIGGGLTELGS